MLVLILQRFDIPAKCVNLALEILIASDLILLKLKNSWNKAANDIISWNILIIHNI